MSETREEFVPYEIDVLTCEGKDFTGVSHDKFANKGGMVYLAGVVEGDDGDKIESVMIPTENIRHIREYSEAEEVEVPEVQGHPHQDPQQAQQAEPEEEEEEEVDESGVHLPDLTVDEIEEQIDDVNNVDYLEACIEEDDRVTAVEKYEERIEELQS